MPFASLGDTVKIHLTAQLKNGEVVYSTLGGDPFLFTLGQGKAIAGVEDAIDGMAPGETKTVTIPAEIAGEHTQPTGVMKIDMANYYAEPSPADKEEEQVATEPVRQYPLLVSTSQGTLLIDPNSPLAGKDLIFEIELLEIVS